jgi:hypothetical protein
VQTLPSTLNGSWGRGEGLHGKWALHAIALVGGVSVMSQEWGLLGGWWGLWGRFAGVAGSKRRDRLSLARRLPRHGLGWLGFGAGCFRWVEVVGWGTTTWLVHA